MNARELYWVGPHGVLVPASCRQVVAADGYNRLCDDGELIERWWEARAQTPTRDDYLAKYARLEAHGLFFYKV